MKDLKNWISDIQKGPALREGPDFWDFFSDSFEGRIVTPSFFFRNWQDTFSAGPLGQIYSRSSWITPVGSVYCQFLNNNWGTKPFSIFFSFFEVKNIKYLQFSNISNISNISNFLPRGTLYPQNGFKNWQYTDPTYAVHRINNKSHGLHRWDRYTVSF